ncbi:conserved exported hypothetical protein [Candidatus Zixiibacteriota bacterium]|nr:conserved exported hypothetical protein [candidate division Zixibacteria bacterium]
MLKRFLFGVVLIAFLMPVAALSQTPTEAAPALKAEAQVCTGIQERMPTGMAETFSPDVGQIYLWSKITGSEGETTIKHIWYYQGKEMATVELPVRSSSYRTWSSKNILPQWTGDWSVKVEDASGNVLKELSFKIEPTAPTQ